MEYKQFDTAQEFVNASAVFMASVCNTSKNDCYIGLAGGKTPVPIYKNFAEGNIDPYRIHIYQTDERYIKKESEDSNYTMLKKSMLMQHEGQWGSVNIFDTSLPMDDALQAFEALLLNVPDGVFDLLVLGVGTDGHVASLFPNTQALDTEALVAHTQTDVHVGHDRLTIAPRVILKAKKICVVLSGEKKRPVYEELHTPTKDIHEFPAHLLQTHDDVTVFFYT